MLGFEAAEGLAVFAELGFAIAILPNSPLFKRTDPEGAVAFEEAQGGEVEALDNEGGGGDRAKDTDKQGGLQGVGILAELCDEGFPAPALQDGGEAPEPEDKGGGE